MRYGASRGFGERILVLDEEAADALLQSVAHQCGIATTLKNLKKAKSEWYPGKPLKGADLVANRYYLMVPVMQSTVDFDSILRETSELLGKIPPFVIPMILHLMVDEFQDSGDLDQTIYNTLPALESVLTSGTTPTRRSTDLPRRERSEYITSSSPTTPGGTP